MKFVFPLPPPLNHQYGITVSKFHRPYQYLTHEARDWETEALMIVRAAHAKEMFTAPVELLIRLYAKFDRDWDSSNKLMSDILQQAKIYHNDRDIFHADILKIKVKDNPRLEVEVNPYVGPRPE